MNRACPWPEVATPLGKIPAFGQEAGTTDSAGGTSTSGVSAPARSRNTAPGGQGLQQRPRHSLGAAGIDENVRFAQQLGVLLGEADVFDLGLPLEVAHVDQRSGGGVRLLSHRLTGESGTEQPSWRLRSARSGCGVSA